MIKLINLRLRNLNYKFIVRIKKKITVYSFDVRKLSDYISLMKQILLEM